MNQAKNRTAAPTTTARPAFNPDAKADMSKSGFDAMAATAEKQANELLAVWCEYGRQVAALPIEHFPTPTHRQLAEIVAAAIEEGQRGWEAIARRLVGDPLYQPFLTAVQETLFPTTPDGAGHLADGLTFFYFEKRKFEIAERITRQIEQGENIEAELAELLKLKAKQDSTKSQPLLERAYSMRFDPEQTPPADEVCMILGDCPIAARGNLSVIQGKSKVGKSAIFSAVIGAAHRSTYAAYGDTLCIEWSSKDTEGAIIHLDTEQSLGDWHAQASRAITRSGIDCEERFISLPLVMFTRSERMEILRQSMEHEHSTRGGIDLVVIDGIADLCTSPNDEAEALELVSEIHAMAQQYACPIFCGLHENPGTDQGKTRGHLGSELNRKAFANLRCDKDTATGISTLYGTDMRKRDIPKEHGFCFAYDTNAGMHTFQGRAAGIKAAEAEEKKMSKARKEWEPIFEQAEIGTNTNCPSLSPEEAREAMRDIVGTKKLPNLDAVKKRMQRAESLGVLRKTEAGKWTLTHAGQIGT